MIKFCSILITALMLFPLGVCQESDIIEVVVTIDVLRSMVAAIGGDAVECTVLVTGMETSHTFDPGTKEREKLEKADIYVEVGLNQEPWSQSLYESVGRDDLIRVIATDGITPEDNGNPHVWLDPNLAKIMLNNIKNGLIKAAPEKREYFENNLKEYIHHLNDVVTELNRTASPYSGYKVIAGTPAFYYFLKFFNFEEVDRIIKVPGQEPTPKHIAEIIKKMEDEDVNVVIGMPHLPTQVYSQIENETGAHVVMLTPLTGVYGVEEYIDLLQFNVNKIVASFKEAERKSEIIGLKKKIEKQQMGIYFVSSLTIILIFVCIYLTYKVHRVEQDLLDYIEEYKKLEEE